MANVTIRKEAGIEPTSAREGAWEPFRAMRDLMNWDPFREMMPAFAQGSGGFAPAFEIKETKDAYLFKADVPGVKEGDLNVTLTGNRLTVAGKRESEKRENGDRYYSYECTYGEFTRSFTLPEGIDAKSVHADLDRGILTVSVQKSPEAQPKKIAIQAPAKRS